MKSGMVTMRNPMSSSIRLARRSLPRAVFICWTIVCSIWFHLLNSSYWALYITMDMDSWETATMELNRVRTTVRMNGVPGAVVCRHPTY